MKPSKDFKIIIATTPEHERLVAEIYYKEKFAVLVSQEREPGQFDLETPGCGLVESLVERRVPLEVLLPAIEAAREELRSSE